MAFPDRVILDVISADIGSRCFSVCGDKITAACPVKLQPVERTLDTVSFDLSLAECRPPVGALVNDASDYAFFVSEQRKLQIQSFYTHYLICFNCLGRQDCVPLIRYHMKTPLASFICLFALRLFY